MKRYRKFLVVLAVLLVSTLLLTACGFANPLRGIANTDTGKVYGFWRGLWDGLTIVFAFIGGIFSHRWNLYMVNNNGGWYNFGYFLGLLIILGGGSQTATHKK